MNIDELRELTPDELEIRIGGLKKDLMDSRFLLATSQLEDTSVFSKIRKQIAQAMTVLNEKNLAKSSQQEEDAEVQQ